MTERIYLWFLSWNFSELTDALNEDPDFYEKWAKKRDEIWARHGVEQLYVGTPYGVVENRVSILKTELDLVEFGKARSEVIRINRKLINYGRTVPVIIR
jgi:hypothetical protein